MVAEIVTKCEAFCKTMNASAIILFKDYETADNVTVTKKDSKGKVIVDYSVDGLGSDDHKRTIEFDIKGMKSKLLKVT